MVCAINRCLRRTTKHFSCFSCTRRWGSIDWPAFCSRSFTSRKRSVPAIRSSPHAAPVFISLLPRTTSVFRPAPLARPPDRFKPSTEFEPAPSVGHYRPPLGKTSSCPVWGGFLYAEDRWRTPSNSSRSSNHDVEAQSCERSKPGGIFQLPDQKADLRITFAWTSFEWPGSPRW